ncbi:RNA polymerase sigma factor [Streptomyces virginiae]|uniref:RNA polymerase sigma factor n=1 Tax=Streptomyces virginiae TaxID=1961 RepID=UPI002DB9CF4D|nr:sigma-70 family RNA polymerase sigma factor [Streptomyces sp. CMAA1738]MEC4575765.1 sigma-70 family RNA polymerase sigma factor [Streptomyces sp. CMAA1738]
MAAAGDRLLAVRAAEGDEEAFELLVHRHSPAMLQLAERFMGSRTEAEDAVQEAFISAWRSLPEYRGEAGFGTWLHRIVTNRCLNLLRARRPAADLETVSEPAAPEHRSSPARAAESSAAARDLARAMSALSAEQRVCWVLREIEGQTYETIARAVRIRPEAVRARVFRARRMLTEAMAAWR